MININMEVQRVVPLVNNAALTLVMFRYARAKSGVTTPIRINSTAELQAAFEVPTTNEVQEFRELLMAEYLLSNNVNLLCYQVAAAGPILAGDITNIADQVALGYKFVIAPYAFLDTTDYATNGLNLLAQHCKDEDVQLFIDIEPFVASTDIDTLKTQFVADASSKLELFVNSGFVGIDTAYTLPTNISLDEAYLATAAVYANATDYVGVPASLIALVRKSKLLSMGKPWLPVAGEDNGLVTEASTLFRELSTTEKEEFQAANVNVLITRVGVGHLFVSQNTMYPAGVGDTLNPLLRSHIITEALWIKSALYRIAQSLEFRPNVQKTWDLAKLKVAKLFKPILQAGGVEDYKVYCGRNITMTNQDILDGKLVVIVNYLPVRVIEDITFYVTIQETTDGTNITLSGGDL